MDATHNHQQRLHSFTCPVPGCDRRFPTLKLLSRHLNCRFRFNRCGAFARPVYFECPHCCTVCWYVHSIRRHASECLPARRRPVFRNQIRALRIARQARGPENQFPTELLAPVYEDCDNYNANLTGATPPSLSDLGYDSNGEDQDGEWFLFGDEDEVEPDDYEDDDSESDDDMVPHLNIMVRGIHYWIHRYRELVRDDTIKFQIEIYRLCLLIRTTHKGYRAMRELSVFKHHEGLPLNLKDLARKVLSFVRTNFLCVTHVENVIIGGKSYPTPYIKVEDAVAIWLTIPSIVATVRRHMTDYLPHNLVDIDEYTELQHRREASVRSCRHTYKVVADGALYLQNVCDAVPKFREQYIRARNDGVEVFLINLGVFEDGFGKNINSSVTQMLLCLTLCKCSIIFFSLLVLK